MPRDGDINQRTQAKLRSGIKAAEIIKALSDHILVGRKMTNTQVRAAEILLRKVSPDMTATALSDARADTLPVLQIVRRSASQERSGASSSEPAPAPAPAESKPDAA